MKVLIVIVLLSVASWAAAKPADTEVSAPEIPSEVEDRSLAKRLLVSTIINPNRNPIFEWSGTVGVRISDVRITVTATNRPPSPSILPFKGGVGSNSVSIDFTNRRGITFRVEVWGR